MKTMSDKPLYFMNIHPSTASHHCSLHVLKLAHPCTSAAVWFQWLAGAERLTRGGSKYLAGSFAKRVIAPD